MKAEGPGMRARCVGPLQHDSRHPGQPQLGGEHQPDRPGPDNDHFGLVTHHDDARSDRGRRH